MLTIGALRRSQADVDAVIAAGRQVALQLGVDPDRAMALVRASDDRRTLAERGGVRCPDCGSLLLLVGQSGKFPT